MFFELRTKLQKMKVVGCYRVKIPYAALMKTQWKDSVWR